MGGCSPGSPGDGQKSPIVAGDCLRRRGHLEVGRHRSPALKSDLMFSPSNQFAQGHLQFQNKNWSYVSTKARNPVLNMHEPKSNIYKIKMSKIDQSLSKLSLMECFMS